MLSPEQINNLLIRAIWTFDTAQIDYLLVEERAPVHFHYGPSATTPFLEAVANGMLDVAEALRRRGADIEARDSYGKNAFLTGIWRYSRSLFATNPAYAGPLYDKTQVLDYLLYCGVKYTARTHRGEDALSLARRLLEHQGNLNDGDYLQEAQRTVTYLEELFTPRGRARVLRLKAERLAEDGRRSLEKAGQDRRVSDLDLEGL